MPYYACACQLSGGTVDPDTSAQRHGATAHSAPEGIKSPRSDRVSSERELSQRCERAVANGDGERRETIVANSIATEIQPLERWNCTYAKEVWGVIEL